MTPTEKKLMENPDHKPLMDLPPVIRQLMHENVGQLNVLRPSGHWGACEEGCCLALGAIYTVAPTVPVTPPTPTYTPYPVFCGSDRIYKVNLTKEWSDNTRVCYLNTCTGMAEFGGIRHKGSQEWKTVLDIITNGEPVEVRFRCR